MITSPLDKYRQSSVQTSTPAQLLLMLYDGAIRFIRAGIDAMNIRDIQNTNLNLGKAQTIVSELSATLDQSFDVSKDLMTLYDYINYLLVEANIKKNAEMAEEALGYMKELRETWARAAKQSALNTEVQNG